MNQPTLFALQDMDSGVVLATREMRSQYAGLLNHKRRNIGSRARWVTAKSLGICCADYPVCDHSQPSPQMQRVQAEKDAIAILQSAHEQMYLEQADLRGLGLMPSARQNLELAISLVWDARKHLQGQKLTMPGLYAGKFFTAERSHETCDCSECQGLGYHQPNPPEHFDVELPGAVVEESFDRQPLPAKIEGKPMPKGVKLSRRELQTVFFVGREIALVNCLMGPTHQKRTVAEQKSFGYVMKTEDGRPSWLRFNAGDEIWMDNGKITILGAEGELEAQYQL